MTEKAIRLLLRANEIMDIKQLEIVRDITALARADALEEAAKVIDAEAER